MSTKNYYPETPNFNVSQKTESAEVLIVPVFQDSSPDLDLPHGTAKAFLDQLKKSGAFQARLSTTEFLRLTPAGSCDSLLWVGLGATRDLTLEKARSAGGSAYLKTKSLQLKSATLSMDAWVSSDLACAFLEGFMLGHYRFTHHKSNADAGATDLKKVTVACKNSSIRNALTSRTPQLVSTLRSINVTRHWSNEPSNIGTPEFFASEAKKLGQEHGLKVRVLSEKDCAKEGLNLFLQSDKAQKEKAKLLS